MDNDLLFLELFTRLTEAVENLHAEIAMIHAILDQATRENADAPDTQESS